MGYYFDHQEEIDQEITLEWQQVQENMTHQACQVAFLYSHESQRATVNDYCLVHGCSCSPSNYRTVASPEA
jgi:hypothetical protein